MERRTKRSHYLPRFYLAGFTQSGDAKSDLWVLDQLTGRSWSSSPANAAIEKHFYAVDVPGEDPDIMEKILSRMETEFSDVTRWIAARQRLPKGDDLNWFLNFVGLMAARTPHMRKVVARVVDRKTKADFRQLMATREGWSRFRETCARTGHSVPDEEYEAFKRFAESEEYEVNLDQTSHVRAMAVEMMDALLPELGARHWSLGIAEDSAPDFVTSSAPVVVWPGAKVDLSKPLSIRSPNTILSFPLGKRLVALARHEPRPAVLGMATQGVALCNHWTISQATHVFSPSADFALLMPDLRIGAKADLLEYHRRKHDGEA